MSILSDGEYLVLTKNATESLKKVARDGPVLGEEHARAMFIGLLGEGKLLRSFQGRTGWIRDVEGKMHNGLRCKIRLVNGHDMLGHPKMSPDGKGQIVFLTNFEILPT